ncbi:protein of unknown function [Taphrina deformans PYCC 5710]|uniref:TRUD domain-containing protein n=1 Tax=Taphrina deformans (strain PYCC 5710 / ATCC 11124 / CBS 356.35 / IMI 108563 / JCM 9778 / NBRC 8474) TaxID=1097556 RepID=R4XIT1_TAPDE|nr:protein of unknown function [Taphrina deformans PYCC 5710]|eukprot:CCG84404.1 protein of unknown function [Taphrina deformans PYCC 5710]
MSEVQDSLSFAPPSKRLKTDVTSQQSGNGDGEEFLPAMQESPKKRLSEGDCGIEVYVNDNLPRFECLLKELTSDFQVFEINQAGEILKLRNVPKQEDLQRDREEAKAQKVEKQSLIEEQKFDYEGEAAKTLALLVGDNTFSKIKELFQYSSDWHGEGANAPLPVITEVISDREKRTSIHKAIREVFLGSLNSEARDDKKMRISYKQKQQNDRNRGSRGGRGGRGGRGRGGRDQGGGDRREAWTEPGDYTIFTVYKDGRDTMDVANNISKLLRIPPKVLGFAGTKDKRGCTVQLFSAYRTHINRIAGICGSNAMKSVSLGDFHYASKGLSLGDLKGNKFVMVLRNVQHSTDEHIHQAFQLIKEKGFVNYYGLQRFGSSATGTQQVGIHILRGEFEAACNAILEEHSGAWRETKEAKLLWIETRNASKTLDIMPGKCVAEVAMLKHMVKTDQKGDWAGAFNSIPRNLRLIYMHAYQSLVWNNATTQRLRRHGIHPIVGDLVLEEAEVPNDTTEINDKDGKAVLRARHLRSEELSNYTIYDVVLPLPGCDVSYPNHDIKEYYAEFMKKEQLDPFNMVRNTKETTLMGSYRKIMSRAIDLEWQILKYGDEQKDAQLVATNLDELEGKTISLPAAGPNTAVRLEFQLESAAYATMLLREALSSVPHSI